MALIDLGKMGKIFPKTYGLRKRDGLSAVCPIFKQPYNIKEVER